MWFTTFHSLRLNRCMDRVIENSVCGCTAQCTYRRSQATLTFFFIYIVFMCAPFYECKLIFHTTWVCYSYTKCIGIGRQSAAPWINVNHLYIVCTYKIEANQTFILSTCALGVEMSMPTMRVCVCMCVKLWGVNNVFCKQ